MTTPLEREILTHYYCYPGPFRGAETNWSYGVSEIVARFISLGLLRRVGLDVEGNRFALQAYMDALAKVPLPVQQWVVPTAPESL